MYSVEVNTGVDEQIWALPASMLPRFQELQALLEVEPESGKPYNKLNPTAATRVWTIGSCMVVYLILEHERRVIILSVLWAG